MLIKEKFILDAFMFAVAVLGAVIAVVTADDDQRLPFALALGLIALIAVGAFVRNGIYRRWHARMMFLDPRMFDDVSAQYWLRAASEADISEIARQQAEWYTATDAIPQEILMEWFRANPNGFIIVCDENGKNIGHVDLLPIKEKTLDLLKRGTIREKDVRGDSIHPPSERISITDLWLESIVITEKNQLRRARILLGIMRQARERLDKLADPQRVRNFYAISATSAGEDLLERLGFSKNADAGERIDAHILHQANSGTVRKHINSYVKPRVEPKLGVDVAGPGV